MNPHNRPDATRERATSIEYDDITHQPKDISINMPKEMALSADERKWREEIERATGLSLPENRQVELTNVRYWGDPSQPFVYCRFAIKDRSVESGPFDAIALLRDLRRGTRNQHGRTKVAATGVDGKSTFVISWNDWQMGKKENGGSAATIERIHLANVSAMARRKELRKNGRDLGTLLVLGGGDMVEGCSIFPNQAYEIDSDRRTQIRNTVATGLDGLDRLAPLFERVIVMVVGGNHGENRIGGVRTTRNDNDDCSVFEYMAIAAERDPKLQHVKFIIADDEIAKTVKVSDHVIGTTHGHAYGKTSSGSIEQKAYKWFMGQSAGRHPIGNADVFITHHFHHFASRDWGATQWIQTPSMDGGSQWLTDMNGQTSQPGMLSFVVTPTCRLQDLQILS